MKITQLGISHFRSIGETPVMIDLEKKITVLVGANDCGKSNVLRGLNEFNRIKSFRTSSVMHSDEEIDCHERSTSAPPRFHVCGYHTEEVTEKTPFDGVYSKGLTRGEWKEHVRPSRVTGMGLNEANKIAQSLPTFAIIPQFRRIEIAEDYGIAGRGIIKLLASWQNPDDSQYNIRSKFERVQGLLCALLGGREVTLDVPRGETKIVVNEGTNHLPLESHGTGIHQLIILAIAVLSQDDVIFGIEEPEIHLHPTLQKRLIKFLKEETTNCYVITTHSPSLIVPDEQVDVVHLRMVNGATIATPVRTDAHTLEALDDLGLRASDLLQANSIIWVEGPSDRIYLRHWIGLLAPDLSEGIDYAIMFYGGRLLAHLAMEEKKAEEDVSRFINLLRLNQRSALVMDSDRKISPKDSINATKQRIVNESQKSGLHTWVTDGREIENELPPRVVEAALADEGLLKPGARFSISAIGIFQNAMNTVMPEKPPAWTQYDKHKPEWAHRFCQQMNKEDLSDSLKKRVEDLIAFIRRRPLSSTANAS